MPQLNSLRLHFYSPTHSIYTPLVWTAPQKGDPIRLLPKPHNPLDPSCIQIHSQNTHLGYVPIRYKQSVSQWLKLWGHSYRAYIQEITSFSPLHEKVTIEIIQEKAENKNAP